MITNSVSKAWSYETYLKVFPKLVSCITIPGAIVRARFDLAAILVPTKWAAILVSTRLTAILVPTQLAAIVALIQSRYWLTRVKPPGALPEPDVSPLAKDAIPTWT